MSRGNRNPTLVEVAMEAGVSTATAARALGNYGRVKESTRTAVHSAAAKLKYRPNELARSMITGKTRSIGVICGDIHNPFFAGIVRGITDEARSQGYTVLIANSDEDWDVEVESLSIFQTNVVDGLIVSPSDTKRVDHLRTWSDNGRPVVMVDRASAVLSTDAVIIDGPQAIEDAVCRLFELGHERIAIVGEFHPESELDKVLALTEAELDTVDVFEFSPSLARLIGYRRAHREHGVPVDPALVIRAGAYSVDAAHAASSAAMSGEALPTAIVTTDNSMSLGAYRAVKELGIEIPRELSFIGFDNEHWTELVTPAIAVVDQPSYSMGQQAARMLLERIDGEAGAPRVLIEPAAYLERGSVAPPARN